MAPGDREIRRAVHYRDAWTETDPKPRDRTGKPRRWPSAARRCSCGLFCSLTPPPPHPSALSGRRPTTTPAASALPRPGSRLCQPAAWPSASSTVRALRTATSSNPNIAAAWYPAAQGWTGKIKPFWFGANHTGLDSEATLALMSKHSVAGYGWQTGGAGQDGVCATVLPVPLDSYAANS